MKNMLKIKLLNLQVTNEFRLLELNPEMMVDCEYLIGKLPECDLVLDSSGVSRIHGKISFYQEKYYFTDLASKGGSQVNNKKAEPQQKYILNTGDIIQIGNFSLLIEVVTTEVKDSTSITDPTHMDWWKKGEITVRCVRIINETPDVKTFCFVSHSPTLFAYKPGQFVTLKLKINGEEVLRSYSISSSPSRPHTLEITVKRVPPPDNTSDIPPGLVSNWLHDNIVIGSEVTLSGPIGNFTYVDNSPPKLLMISAGSGITPMMSMLRWLYDTVDNRDVVFVHSARSPQDVIFRQELELIAARRNNFRLVIITTRLEPGQIWLGFTGRLSEALLQTITPDLHERQVYVCGPESFMQQVKAMFESLNFPMQNYYEESFGLGKKSKKLSQLKAQAPLNEVVTQKVHSFGLSAILSSFQLSTPQGEQLTNGYSATQRLISSASNSSSTSTTAQPVIVFAESGKEVTSDGEESILELAEQKGIKIRSSCRMGSCGTCKKLKTEGQIRMEKYDPEALDQKELEAGYFLTCIAYPLGRVVINA